MLSAIKRVRKKYPVKQYARIVWDWKDQRITQPSKCKQNECHCRGRKHIKSVRVWRNTC